MPLPSTLIPTTPPLSGLSLVQQTNDWLGALKTCWAGSAAPPSLSDGMLWLDTGPNPDALRLRLSGSWVEVNHSGNSLKLGATAAAGRTTLDVAPKQSDTSDPSTGRGLIVGAFGLGGAAISAPNNSLGQISAGGLYRIVTDTTGNPADAGSGSVCLAIPWSATVQAQITIDPADNRVWVRGKLNGSYSNWDEIPAGANVGRMVSEIGVGDIGAPRFCLNTSGSSIGSSATVSGSLLRASSTDVGNSSSTPLVGTWRCQSFTPAGAAGLFVRVS